MRVHRLVITLLAAVGLALSGVPATHAAASTSPGDGVTVTQALVNRLGGVSVVGKMSCADSAEAIVSGQAWAEDLYTGEWVPVAFAPGDGLILLTNPDNYVVTQPISRKFSVRATHASSRAHPCFVLSNGASGVWWPDTQPDANGFYPWATDQFGYNTGTGPLYDYAVNGRFKTGSLNVTGNAIGIWITVVHPDGSFADYGDANAFFMPYNLVVRAVAAR